MTNDDDDIEKLKWRDKREALAVNMSTVFKQRTVQMLHACGRLLKGRAMQCNQRIIVRRTDYEIFRGNQYNAFNIWQLTFG